MLFITETEVNIDFEDIKEQVETNELIAEIESRDYRVLMPGETDENVEAFNHTLDEIHELYLDYVSGGIPVERLKKFFEEQLGVLVY